MPRNENDSEFVIIRHHRNCDSLRVYGGGCKMGGSFPGTSGRCTCKYIEERRKQIEADEVKLNEVEQIKKRILCKLNMTEEELKLLLIVLRNL